MYGVRKHRTAAVAVVVRAHLTAAPGVTSTGPARTHLLSSPVASRTLVAKETRLHPPSSLNSSSLSLNKHQHLQSVIGQPCKVNQTLEFKGLTLICAKLPSAWETWHKSSEKHSVAPFCIYFVANNSYCLVRYGELVGRRTVPNPSPPARRSLQSNPSLQQHSISNKGE